MSKKYPRKPAKLYWKPHKTSRKFLCSQKVLKIHQKSSPDRPKSVPKPSPDPSQILPNRDKIQTSNLQETKSAPRATQERPKSAQELPRDGPDPPKTLPNQPQDPPQPKLDTMFCVLFSYPNFISICH